METKKLKILKSIVSRVSDKIKKILLNSHLIGLCERVTYHKIEESERIPYTHIFDNPAVLLKLKKLPILIIYGKKIKFRNKFIEDN